MRSVRSPFPSAPVRLIGLLVGVLLLMPACQDSGPHSLSDVSYWRIQFSNGEGIKTVVAQGAAATPLLTQLLGDQNEYVVQTAAMAVQQIGQPAAGTVPAMLDALSRFPKQPYVIEALKSMKGAAVSYLVPMLSDSNAEGRMRAVVALNGIGASAEPAIEPLLKILENGSSSTELKRATLVTMGSIGEPAVPYIMRINEFALKNDDLRNDAAMAMKRIKTAKKVRIKGGDR